MASMLTAAVNGSKKTRLMYAVGLNTRVTERYIGQLLQSGLLSCNNLGKTYFLTQKGAEFLNLFSEYEAALKNVFERRLILSDFIDSCEAPPSPSSSEAQGVSMASSTVQPAPLSLSIGTHPMLAGPSH